LLIAASAQVAAAVLLVREATELDAMFAAAVYIVQKGLVEEQDILYGECSVPMLVGRKDVTLALLGPLKHPSGRNVELAEQSESLAP
jgi:hypothetical protein